MQQHTILIADDDLAILDALTLILEDEGYKVITTANGAQVQKMMDKKPDLLLLDIWMSGMDGRDICVQLKKQDTTKKVPVIMISANRDTKEIALACGADDFITKPFEMDELLKKVAQYLV